MANAKPITKFIAAGTFGILILLAAAHHQRLAKPVPNTKLVLKQGKVQTQDLADTLDGLVRDSKPGQSIVVGRVDQVTPPQDSVNYDRTPLKGEIGVRQVLFGQFAKDRLRFDNSREIDEENREHSLSGPIWRSKTPISPSMRVGQYWLLIVKDATGTFDQDSQAGGFKLNGLNDPYVYMYKQYSQWMLIADTQKLLMRLSPILANPKEQEATRIIALKILGTRIFRPYLRSHDEKAAPNPELEAEMRSLKHTITLLLATGDLPHELRMRVMRFVHLNPDIKTSPTGDDALQLRYLLTVFLNSKDLEIKYEARDLLRVAMSGHDDQTHITYHFPEIEKAIGKQDAVDAQKDLRDNPHAQGRMENRFAVRNGRIVGYRIVMPPPMNAEKVHKVDLQLPPFDNSELGRKMRAASLH